MNKSITRLLASATVILTAYAASAGNVKWTTSTQIESLTTGKIIASAQVEEGYHFYSFDNREQINSLEFDAKSSIEGIELGGPTWSVSPTSEYDPAWKFNVSVWHEDVDIIIPYKLADAENMDIDALAAAEVNIALRYQSCRDGACTTPEKLSFNVALGKDIIEYALKESDQGHSIDALGAADKDKLAEALLAAMQNREAEVLDAAAPIPVVEKDSEELTMEEKMMAVPSANPTEAQAEWWAPVATEGPISDQSPWGLLIIGFLGGLAALLTPCVWPLIPMTLSFFLKKKKGKGRLNKDALIYGASIVVIYLVLGLAITMIFGAGKLNELSTSAVFNLIFFLLLVVFAVSFFGAFDIKLPRKWSNAMDNKAESTSGMISIFFMAFTLVLVSFSCTGPIIGTLLVEAAASGDIVGPAFGMGGFALGLAVPFTIFAIFPGMLKEMPKSGGWLNSVKVVLGFIELILSLKFLSVADLAYGWHILDRETFLAIWIVLFILLGLYLLGKIRFAHDAPTDHVGVWRFMLSIFPFAFAVYLIPGLWGAPLKSISAFAPPLWTQDFNLYVQNYDYVHFYDYDEAMEYAAENEMPVLIDFSGHGCVNCRNMETNIVNTDEVMSILSDNFVVVTLMTDEREPLPAPVYATVDGEKKTFTETGEKWAYLQHHKFGAAVQPYYIVVDNQGKPMNNPTFYDGSSISKFSEWLNEGLDNYTKKMGAEKTNSDQQ